MGDYADDQIRRDQRAAAKRNAAAAGYELDDDDDDGQVDYYRAQAAARQEERRGQLEAAHVVMPTTKAALAELGLTLEAKSDYHFHVLRIEGRQRTLVAQWWPSSGKTMDGQRRGQHCATGTALVAWLRDKQKSEARRG